MRGAPPPAKWRSARRALFGAGLAVGSALACGSERSPRYPDLAGPGSARPGAAAQAAPVTAAAAATAPDACAAANDCTACVAQSGCRWCSDPAGCRAANAPCPGLSLGHPAHCAGVSAAGSQPDAVGEVTRGMTPNGPPIEARLESFPGIELEIVRGHCYALVLRLGPGAEPGDGFVSVEMSTRQETSVGSSGWLRRDTPPIAVGPYCPLGPGRLRFAFVDRFTRARLASNGKGPISFQLHTAPASEQELQRREAAHAALMQKIDRMPADCDDCDFNCGSARRDCERRCFVDFRNEHERRRCEYGCEQIERACTRQCDSRCG
jgi:hypothetical protein